MTDIPLIAVTGGPCSGKTTLLAAIESRLAAFGMHTIVVPEAATEVIRAGISPKLVGNREFQRGLLPYLLKREDTYRAFARKILRPVILCDRGALDCEAYLPSEAVFERLLEEMGYDRGTLLQRYTMVIHLVTAADGAEEYYTLANNAARTETPAEARVLDTRTKQAWIGHPKMSIIGNDTDFETKKSRAIDALGRVLDMPLARQRQRKYQVHAFTEALLPGHARSAHLSQTYLIAEAGFERRVRLRHVFGKTSCTYTEKHKGAKAAERIVRERLIAESEYRALLAQADLRFRPIEKTRYYFEWRNRHFELDVFSGERKGLVMLEAEVADLNDPIDLPPELSCTEVTGDPAFENRMLARTM
jgi:CYTH domain-containing protein/predicted ATPase